MGLQYSTAVNNGRLDAIETAISTSAVLKIRTGAPPANCAAADAGSVLANLALPSDWMAAASGGAKAKSGTWQDASADAGGNAGHFRVYANDGTTCHMQGIIFMTGLSAWAASTAYVVGDKRTNNGNVYVVTTGGTSAGSGGPSGTGSAITDNTVTWQYVCPASGDMSLDNAQIGAGQTVSVTSFTITAANT
jgi:hypothetical protein